MSSQHHFELIAAAKNAKTPRELRDVMYRLMQRYSFSSYCMAGVPLPGEAPRDYAILSGWPEEWYDLYMNTDRWQRDPVVDNCLTRREPIVWSEDVRVEKQSKEWEIMGEASEFGLTDGITVPIIHAKGGLSLVCYATDKVMLNETERFDLQVITGFIFHAAYEMAQKDRPFSAGGQLTRRQRECLRFIAQGYSENHTALLMGIAPRTVRFHLDAARTTLGAENRAHAVWLAARYAEL